MSAFPGHVFTPGPDSGQPQRQPAQLVAGSLTGGEMVAAAQPTGQVAWLVYRVTVQATQHAGAAVGAAFLRVDGVVVDGTQTGAFDVDEASPPIYVPPGSTIDVIWPGLTNAGDVASARFEYYAVGR